MRFLLKFIAATVVGGLVFLVPFALILLAIGKLFSLLRPVAGNLGTLLNPLGVGPGVEIAIVIFLLVVFAFVAGLLGLTYVGKSVVDWLEAALLNRVPGYTIVKSAAADAAGGLAQIESSAQTRSVFVQTEDGWQIGFPTDQIGDDLWAVFIPDAPTPSTGSVIFLTSDKFVDSGLSVADSLRCLRQLGAGSSRMLGPRPS